MKFGNKLEAKTENLPAYVQKPAFFAAGLSGIFAVHAIGMSIPIIAHAAFTAVSPSMGVDLGDSLTYTYYGNIGIMAAIATNLGLNVSGVLKIKGH